MSSVQIDIPMEYTDYPRELINQSADFDFQGVYVFYDLSKIPLYVGKSINVGSRIRSHSNSSPFFFMADGIRIYSVEDAFMTDILETYLISDLKPEYNIDKTYYTGDSYGFMLSRIDERVSFYTRRESGLLSILNPSGGDYGEDIFGEADILDAERALKAVRSELDGLKLRERHIKRRKMRNLSFK